MAAGCDWVPVPDQELQARLQRLMAPPAEGLTPGTPLSA
jgi:hypothetical protein